MIKNVIFDLGNVILKFNSKNAMKFFTNDEDVANNLMKYVYKTEEWKLLDLGNISYEEATYKMQEKAPKEYSNLIQKLMDERINYISTNEDIINIAKNLKEKGYNIFVLSNMAKQTYEHFQDIDFFKLCNGIVVSAYEHVVKPDEKIFNILLDRYNLKPEECLFIDDDDTGRSFETANKLGILGRKVKPNDSKDVLKLLEENNIKII